MSTPAPTQLQDIAAQWRAARRIYPIYAAVISRFNLNAERCKYLESPVDRADSEALNQVHAWLDQLDATVEPGQLRQVLQSESSATDAAMRILVQRYLTKPQVAEKYQEKIDFVLTQFFSHAAPIEVLRGPISSGDVAKVLEPVIGPSLLDGPEWLKRLDGIIQQLDQAQSLRDLVKGRVLEQGREIKKSAGASLVEPSVLVGFTRYNFLVRRAFIRLVNNDLEQIRRIALELKKRNVSTVDASAAGLGAASSLDDILLYCLNWKKIFRVDFSERQVGDSVVHLLIACEEKLKSTPVPEVAASPKPQPATPKPQPVTPKAAPDPASLRFTMQQVIESIGEQLVAAKLHEVHLATGTVAVGQAKVLLSSWEVAAFLKNGGELSAALQEGVAVRAMVADVVERSRQGAPAADLPAARAVAHKEAARLQERIAQARDARNIDAAVNLAATQKRLVQTLDEAEKIQAGSKS